ncbi:MAG: site-specific integrase [Proteobacteria bacterium]|nr:site-specific integrase [Pseudomonadota bacterium]MBU2468247.1 site-specific integrase [Pseudomonadota bacterium]MBU2518175.1 site-specific integrase [Pseudomonadota bacterium]
MNPYTRHDLVEFALWPKSRRDIFSNLGDVDLGRKVLTLRDTKSGHTRPALMTDDVHQMLSDRQPGAPSELVFPSTSGGKRVQVSKTFNRTVEELGFNRGIKDSRQKVVFHTCRHSYASWLVQDGVDLYVLQKLIGHASITMTQRYSHLAPGNLQHAVNVFQSNWDRGKVINLAEDDK